VQSIWRVLDALNKAPVEAAEAPAQCGQIFDALAPEANDEPQPKTSDGRDSAPAAAKAEGPAHATR
jgi:hypothetical protein